jgi:hypothetical protein
VKRVATDVTFWIKTIDQSAYAGKDYVPKRELMTMKADEIERDFTVRIIDDNVPEGNETFAIAIYDELGDQRLLGPDTYTTVTILDNDNPGYIGFAQNEIYSSPNSKHISVFIKIFEGTKGEASCTLRCSTLCNDNNPGGIKTEEQVYFGNGQQ